MNLIAREIFSLKSGLIVSSTEIGGVSSVISTAQILATTLGVSVTRISNFEIVGTDIKCNVTGNYILPVQAFYNNALITYFHDLGGAMTETGGASFYGTTKLKSFKAKNLTKLGYQSFDLDGKIGVLENIYIPKCTTIGGSGYEYVFRNRTFYPSLLVLDSSCFTSNAGNPDADLTEYINNGGNAKVWLNDTAPSIISDLSFVSAYNQIIKLGFTTPVGNEILYYKVYVNGVLNNICNKAEVYADGLASSTSYIIKIEGFDVSGNTNGFSNQITCSTNATTAFISKWNTMYGGVSSNKSVKLPLIASGTYNFTVYWGDGTSNVITAYNQTAVTHNYSEVGEYSIVITGTLYGWSFGADAGKLISITQWGGIRLGNVGSYFSGCSRLSLVNVIDILDLTGTTNLSWMFNGYSKATIARINEWNVSAVTNFWVVFLGSAFNDSLSNWNMGSALRLEQMFQSASFNQNIGMWNVSNCTNFALFMPNKTPATLSSANLDAIYNGWSSRPVKPNITISFGSAKYTSASSAARAILTGAPNNWTITDGGIL
jgi:hypothetical protein